MYETNTIDLLYILEELRHINLLGIDYILTDDFAQEDDRNRAILIKYEQLYRQQKEINNTNVKQEEEQAEKELEKVRQKELEINSLEVPDKIQANCKIEAYIKSVGKRQKINEKKEKKTKNKVEISDQSKSTLGIKGEKYIYQNLVGENTNLLKQLGISKEDYEQIIFYNINYTQLKEDLSIGHGCDIEIILKNKEHLYLEVKTSYDALDYYSMTCNEYRCSMENQDKYFVIKVSNFKYIQKDESKIKITIIKNPYKIFMENTDILKNITFF